MSAEPLSPPRRPARAARGVGSDVPPRRDPAIAKALQLSTFEDNYSTEDFIGTLSEKLIAESKADPGPFNPAPFMQTFSPALDALLQLRAQVAERTKKMETEVRRANREYGKRLRELDSGFEAVGSSFSSIENKMSDVGRTAARIGEQLESLHHTRSTAQATSLLLSYYMSLVHQTSTTGESAEALEALFATRNTREGRTRLALVLRRLSTVAKDVADNAAQALADAEGAEKKEENGDEGASVAASRKQILHRRGEKEKADRVRDEVEKYCERFEKEVLRYFDRSYRKGDPRMMAHCAKVLEDFNGGTSCVQIYVNQHDFFISKDRVAEGGLDDTEMWRSVGDPNAPPPTSEPGLEALFKEIRETVAQEAQIVKAVFPNPSAVMQVFLQRIFAQVIQQHIESLVSRASTISTLAILRVLYLAHTMCSRHVEDLKVYDATLGGSAAGPSKLADASTGPIAALLDQAMEEIFVPWLEGSRYLDTESKNLVELYAGLVGRFTRYHEMVQKAKPNSLLDRVVGSTSAPSSTAHAAAAAFTKHMNLFATSATSAFSSASGRTTPVVPARSAARLSMQGPPSGGRLPPSRGESMNEQEEDRLFSTDGNLSVDMAQRMLRWHAEAVGRVVELSPSADVAKNVLSLSRVLADAIGRSFVETALDSALFRLEQSDSRAEPDLTGLAVLRSADLVCHLWQRYTSTALVPLTSSSTPVRREIATFNQHNVVRMEGKVNALIQKALDAITAWLAYLLSKQKKGDFKPRNDELSFARTNTEPCELSCDFLAIVKDAAGEGLSGKNLEAFLTEIGVAFHSLLLDHFKKWPVNPTGGLMLTKDLASYQEAIASYRINALNDRFDMLRQLGNSFIVQPDVLKSYMTESHLGRIDPRLLRPYLAQRTDWSQISRTLALDDGTDDSPAPSGTSTPSGIGNIGNIGIGGLSMSGLGTGGALIGRSATKRISAMSGAAGASMQRLRDALRDHESPTETSGGAESQGQGRRAPPSAFQQAARSGSGTKEDKKEPPKRGYANFNAYMGIMH